MHPICYDLPLSTIGYHHFFLHVVTQTTLLIASLFELFVYKFLIRLLFMFMSPWKVSEPLSMLFAMVLTFFYYWHLLHLSSIRLWNSWKVCRITITRWPLWPTITFITFGSLCSSVPFITISTSNTTGNFITFGLWGLVSSLSPFGPWAMSIKTLTLS